MPRFEVLEQIMGTRTEVMQVKDLLFEIDLMMLRSGTEALFSGYPEV